MYSARVEVVPMKPSSVDLAWECHRLHSSRSCMRNNDREAKVVGTFVLHQSAEACTLALAEAGMSEITSMQLSRLSVPEEAVASGI